jgi:hypothetical protein
MSSTESYKKDRNKNINFGGVTEMYKTTLT